MLGGVRVPYRLGLLGHSDADVLIHALCDALLGAASLGDIGMHFPDTNRKYKDIPSLILLHRVGKLITQRNFEIVHLDSTLILQQPKIHKYIPRMQRNVARALGIVKDRVSIKATTSEGIGFAGRGEGAAALAVATILPLHEH